MKITISSTVPYRITDYEMEDKDCMTEIGAILFANCLWGHRGMAEAISYYLRQLGYKKVTNG